MNKNFSVIDSSNGYSLELDFDVQESAWNEKLDNGYVFEFFQKMDYAYLHKMFKDLEKIIETRIKTNCMSMGDVKNIR